MASTRQILKVPRANGARVHLTTGTSLSARSLHSSAVARKSVVGWLLGKEDKSVATDSLQPEVKTSSETKAGRVKSSPTINPSSETANATPLPSSTELAAKSSASPTRRPDTMPSKKRATWPRFQHLHIPDLNKQPRRLPPALEPLADSSHSLSETERAERFNLLIAYVRDRVGREPAVRDGRQVRDSSWSQLIQLSTTEAQLTEVVELMPKWLESKREFKESVAVLLIERAHQINATPVAIRVFLDYLHYGLKVPSLDHASALICSSLQPKANPDKATLQNIVALTTVLRLQRLPPITSNVFAASAFAGALAHPRMRNSKSYLVLLSVLPGLRDLTRDHVPVPAQWRKSIAPLLTNVQSFLRLHGVHALWLRAFRKENGLLPAHAELTTWATQVKRDRRARRAALKNVTDPGERKQKAEEMLKEQRKRLLGLVAKDGQFGRSKKAVPTPFTEAPGKSPELVA